MRPSTFFKFTPFSELPHAKQREEYVSLQVKIEAHKPQTGFDFWCSYSQQEREVGRPALYDQVEQFQFLGSDGQTIWNAYLSTAAREYWGNISELATDAVDAALSPEDIAKHREFHAGRNWLTADNVMKAEDPYPSLGNRTRSEWTDEYEENLIKNDTGTTALVYESFRIDPEFEYGIGLYAIMDVDTINPATMETMIARFRAIGEKDWTADTPVPLERLPKKTFDALCRDLQ